MPISIELPTVQIQFSHSVIGYRTSILRGPHAAPLFIGCLVAQLL
jgi:hypothetical protein